MKNIHLLLLLALVMLSTQTGSAQPDLVITQITSVTTPVDITGAGDGSNRIFIVNKAGYIRIYDKGSNTLLPGNFLDIFSKVLNNGEQGFLGLAFHPNYASNGYFFVNYISASSGNTIISRFQNPTPSSNGPVDISTELVLFSIPQPFSNHNGGDLNFGPDGYLYIGMGDGGDAGDPGNRAQNPQQLLGKMLRVDVDGTSPGKNYAIPPSNPYAGSQTVLKEIWAMGVRNPWRFSFDRLTGDLWIADVGQGNWEEVNFQSAGSAGGQNYGWKCYEGRHNFVISGCGPMSSYASPIFEYNHVASTGGNSITGGFVYRGALAPALQGWYVAADYTSDNFWLIHSDGTYDLQTDVPIVDVVTFGEDDDGELYVSSYGGQIYRVTSAPLPIELTTFSGRYQDGRSHLIWSTATEKNGAYFEVEKKMDNGDFQAIGRVDAAGESLQPQNYFFDDPLALPGENVYRLRMIDRDGRFQYSNAITIVVKEIGNWQLSPNPATGKVTLSVNGQTEPPVLRFEVYNAQGRQVLLHEQVSPALPYQQDIQIGHLPAGTYFCRLGMEGKTEVRRLVIE